MRTYPIPEISLGATSAAGTLGSTVSNTNSSLDRFSVFSENLVYCCLLADCWALACIVHTFITRFVGCWFLLGLFLWLFDWRLYFGIGLWYIYSRCLYLLRFSGFFRFIGWLRLLIVISQVRFQMCLCSSTGSSGISLATLLSDKITSSFSNTKSSESSILELIQHLGSF